MTALPVDSKICGMFLNWNSCILEMDIKISQIYLSNCRKMCRFCMLLHVLTLLHLQKNAKHLTKLLKKLRCHGPNVVSATGTTSGIESHLRTRMEIPYSKKGWGTSTQVLLVFSHNGHINGPSSCHSHTSSRNGKDIW